MHECYSCPVHAHPRFGVDELQARLSRVAQSPDDVRDPVCDMVQARPALRQELSNRRVVTKRRHQLEPTIAAPKKRRFQALLLIGGAMHKLRTERRSVQPDRLVEIGHRHSDMMDSRYRCQGHYCTEKILVTALRVIRFGSSPSILSLPLRSLAATPLPTPS